MINKKKRRGQGGVQLSRREEEKKAFLFIIYREREKIYIKIDIFCRIQPLIGEMCYILSLV